jgi:adenylate cyclase
LQDKYHGWLEAYVGDMVCYYWPFSEDNKEEVFQNALQAAIELSALQQNFFASVSSRYADKFEPEVLTKITKTINAGVALTSGLVVMGDLGPKNGVRKFGILGDPLNLVSRIEGLTRLFNCEIIITEELTKTIEHASNASRRLGFICVKGRIEPVMLYAIGNNNDERFSQENIFAWEKWLAEIEQQHKTNLWCPEIYFKDKSTIENWYRRGLLTKQGIWNLQEK